jgi:hypothetical protein
MYWVHRIHCLEAGDVGKLAHKSVLMGCVEAIRGRYRDFQPLYDKKFFGQSFVLTSTPSLVLGSNSIVDS